MKKKKKTKKKEMKERKKTNEKMYKLKRYSLANHKNDRSIACQ